MFNLHLAVPKYFRISEFTGNGRYIDYKAH